MKFSEQFEYHKIPEWYSEYLDYQFFKTKLKDFRSKVKCMIILILLYNFCEAGELTKLRGLYTLTSKGCVLPMDILESNNARRVSNSNTITIRQISHQSAPRVIEKVPEEAK